MAMTHFSSTGMAGLAGAGGLGMVGNGMGAGGWAQWLPAWTGWSAEAKMSAVAMPIFLLLIVAELVVSNQNERPAYHWRDTLANVYLTLLNSLLDAGVRVLVAGSVMAWLYAERVVTMGPGWGYWAGLFVAVDLMSYWIHRIEHTSRVFWAVHVTHHSSTLFNFTTGIRSSVLQPLYRFAFFAPLGLLGFAGTDIWLVFAASQLYGHLMHTRRTGRVPLWDGIFVTPSHHRVHHASNACYVDKNMGTVLILWDRLFGTFVRERADEPPVFGLVKSADIRGPFKLWLHEWRSLGRDVFRRDPALPLAARLGYVFNPPGWRHGEDKADSAGSGVGGGFHGGRRNRRLRRWTQIFKKEDFHRKGAKGAEEEMRKGFNHG